MKIINGILLSIFFALICANITPANQYYCSQDTNLYNVSYIYDDSMTVEEKCEWLKKEFFAKKHPNGYADCVKKDNELKNSFIKGICTPILTKTYTQGNSKCTVHYFKRGEELKETLRDCYGTNTDSLESQIDKIYN